MVYIHRALESNIKRTLARGKSVLLLGPKTGKTTLNFIDKKAAQFILTGSSARKLIRSKMD